MLQTMDEATDLRTPWIDAAGRPARMAAQGTIAPKRLA